MIIVIKQELIIVSNAYTIDSSKLLKDVPIMLNSKKLLILKLEYKNVQVD